MAARFWVAQPVSNAIVSVASAPQIRLTVSSTTGMTTGDTRTVFGVVGTTEANGSWVITVIDSTHIDLQGTTFSNLYTSGGSVNGRWDGSNTNNWVTTSGGTNYGQTVPGASDAATFDASSGGGTVTLNFGGTITIQAITWGNFTGTIDNSINNNNMTLNTSPWFSGSGTGARTFNGGTATYTVSSGSGSSVLWNMGVVTNLTNPTTAFSSATIVLNTTAVAGQVANTFSGGGLTYGTVTFGSSTNFVGVSFAGSNSVGTLNVNAPNTIYWTSAATNTITTALNVTGSSISAPVAFISSSAIGVSTIARSGATVNTLDWITVRGITVTGGTITVTNGRDFGGNTGLSITIPLLGAVTPIGS